MHHCANVVTGADGDGQAVLLRALTPARGRRVMRRAAGTVATADLADGPASCARRSASTCRHDGARPVRRRRRSAIVDDGTPPPDVPVTTPRIGITKAVDLPWRFVAPP